MENKKYGLVVLIVFMILFIAGIISMNYLQSDLNGSNLSLGIDLYPRWIGSEAVLNGQSPYSLKTRTDIWQGIYGSKDQPDGNPFGFYYPPQVVTLIIPFIYFGLPFEIAAILWCAFLLAIWSTVLFLWISQQLGSGGHKKPFMQYPLLLLISGLVFRPAFSNYILGQNSLFCILMLVAACTAYYYKKEYLVGIFASLSLIKPSLTIIPVIILMILYYRNIKGYLSFIFTSILLLLPPTIMLGWWVPDFLKDISWYAIENRVSWSLGDITSLAGIIWSFTTLYLILHGFKHKDKLLVLASSLAMSSILVPHTADYDLVAFICLIYWLENRREKFNNDSFILKTSLLMLISFPWFSLWFFLLTGLPLAVENWYRFIWQVYPTIILLSVFVTSILIGKKLIINKNQINFS